MGKIIVGMFICFLIGACSGWYVAKEWGGGKTNSDEWKPVEAKRLATKDDIKILDWSKKYGKSKQIKTCGNID